MYIRGLEVCRNLWHTERMAKSMPPPSTPDLASLPVGARGTVADIDVPDEIRGELYAMGLLEGVEIQVVRRAPMGGAVLVLVEGSQYALGRDVASRILMTTG